LLVAMLVLGGAGVAYAAGSYPVDYAAPSGNQQGKDDSLLAEGVDGLLGGWLGDAKDPGELAD
jgi:hypothetical protein